MDHPVQIKLYIYIYIYIYILITVISWVPENQGMLLIIN